MSGASRDSTERTTPRARVRRHPPAVRRRLIIEAAREVIARRGTAATRMREVAAAAEVSLGTVTYHFRSIDEVLAEVIQAEETDFFRPLVEQALAADTGREGLRRLVDGLLNDEPRTRQHWLLWLDFWTLASRDATYGRWQHEAYEASRDVIRELVARGHADGTLVVVEEGVAVSTVMALIDGVAAQAYLVGRRSTVVPVAPHVFMWSLVADLFEFPADAPPDAPPAPPAVRPEPGP